MARTRIALGPGVSGASRIIWRLLDRPISEHPPSESVRLGEQVGAHISWISASVKIVLSSRAARSGSGTPGRPRAETSAPATRSAGGGPPHVEGARQHA